MTKGIVVPESIMKAYFESRNVELLRQDGTIFALESESFFQLGTVLDGVQINRSKVRKDGDRLDNEWQTHLDQLKTKYDKNPSSLDQLIPPCQFDTSRIIHFVLCHLQRLLVQEARSFGFKQGDGLDFCHAVISAAHGSIMTLDKA